LCPALDFYFAVWLFRKAYITEEDPMTITEALQFRLISSNLGQWLLKGSVHCSADDRCQFVLLSGIVNV
jgi:hypothetical protein